jgi:flavorubredoxin
MDEWVSGPEMAAQLKISRQMLHKVTPLLAYDRLAERHGRLWKYNRAKVLNHYDCYISHWRPDSPRDALR